ncbi:MAG: beta-propeller fold lactonase family protein, partial [Gemmataceae bacterium]|nr:beta-propeller fold lactonase family protein [Gemmataceae bacterium]
YVAAAAAAPTGRVFVTNERANTVSVISDGTLKVEATIAVGKQPRGIGLAPDGSAVYVALGRENAIAVIDPKTLKVLRKIPSGDDPEAFGVHPNGYIYISNEDAAKASVIDPKSDKVIAEIPVGLEPEGVAISPDGKQVIVTSESTNMLHIIAVPEHKVVANILVGARPRAAVFARDGKIAYATSEIGGEVKRVDMIAHKVLNKVPLGDDKIKPKDVLLSRDERTLYVAGGRADQIIVLDAQTLRVKTRIPVGQRVWGLDGKELLNLDAGDVVAGVAFSPDGKQIAAATIDQMVRLWDAGTGKPVRSWVAHHAAVSAVAYSPNGKLLATCGADQLVRIWKLDTPEAAPLTLTGHNGPLSSVAFRRDGQFLVSGGADGVVKLWRLENGSAKEAQNFRGHRDWVTNVAFSKDGFYIVSASVDKTVKVWEVTSKELPLSAEHTGSVEAVAVSPDGKLIASGATDRVIKLWDRESGVEVMTLPGHSKGVTGLAFSPDGKTLISGSTDQSIRRWDPKTGKPLPEGEGHRLNFHNLLTLSGVPVLQATPDSKRLVAWVPPDSSRYTTLKLFDLETGKELVSFNDSGRHAASVAFTPDGKKAAVGARDGSVRVYEVESKQQQAGGDWFLFERGVGVDGLAYGPEGKVLVAGGENGEVKVCDPVKKQVLHTLKGHTQKVVSCVVSPNGKYAATVGQEGMVKLWDLAKGAEARRWELRTPLQSREEYRSLLTFTPDSRHLLIANANTTLYMLEVP